MSQLDNNNGNHKGRVSCKNVEKKTFGRFWIYQVQNYKLGKTCLVEFACINSQLLTPGLIPILLHLQNLFL